ncbi:ABC transporter permease [Thermomonospora curvata]|uniref:ABC transporter permease n=1 Tax=Thermomonospora curvata TaxID=2020 RepID=UPI001FE12CB6|nr:ABC transporter permease [Thermomonospora curvata]
MATAVTGGAAPEAGVPLAVVLAVLTAGAALLVRLGGLGKWHEVVVAAARATGQLAAVSLLIAVVLGGMGATAAFVSVMLVIAALTAGRRITGATGRGAVWAGASIVAGVGPVLGLVLAAGVVPAAPVSVLPIAGILIGGAMTATALAGRRALEELEVRHGEYEAALALGLLPRDAALEVTRPAAAPALVPVMDQTRTVGLVTLPGAFIGMILGGANPLAAGVVQLLVLVGLLAAEAACVLVTVELVAAGRLRGRR